MRKTILLLLCALVLVPWINAEAASSDNLGEKLIASAEKYLGTPYRYGASESTTDAFDCSSFTKKAFSEIGISLPRVSASQFTVGQAVKKEDLQPGDLVFFDTIVPGRVGHVGIYVGDGKMINAASSGGVSYANIFTSSYWSKYYLGAKRVIDPSSVAAPAAETKAPPVLTNRSMLLPASYTVKKGDTLYKISKTFRVSITNIKKFNRLTSDAVKPGQILKLH